LLNDAKGFSRIIIACGRTDLRRGIDGLAAVVQEQFQLDPTEKNVLFLFCGTKADRIKGLIFEGDGYLLVYKRLSAGRFRWPRTQEEAMAITQEQFDLLMQGMTIVSTIRQANPKRLC
jgi:transposase